MYGLDDTIVAVSSPSPELRAVIRISGPDTLSRLDAIFSPAVSRRGVVAGRLSIEPSLSVDAAVYVFKSPHSYTGEDVIELHVLTNRSLTERMVGRLLEMGLRIAEPGEFTARAYLNGKMDLAQAEAVNEIITSSNRFQLAAAEKLLAGHLAAASQDIRLAIMDCLSRIEAGLDFSQEDIEFITAEQATVRLQAVREKLDRLLLDSIRCESLAGMPTVGIAGAPGAGKSTLLNKLLGSERSIVSGDRKTTRDVLTGELTLHHCRCVIFDCAGLITEPRGVLDELAQQAATEALRNALVTVFCVDISKSDRAEDLAMRELISPRSIIRVATKADLVSADILDCRLADLQASSGKCFVPISAKTGLGLDTLRTAIDREIVAAGTVGTGPDIQKQASESRPEIALAARHQRAVSEAIENMDKSVAELQAGSEEVAAMLLRSAYRGVCTLEQHSVDEKILDEIFSRFCIGK